MKKIKATIIKFEGDKNAICEFGHVIGQEFIFDHMGCDKPMCVYALEALLPAVNILMHGGSFPWAKPGEPILWGCPHPGSLYPGMGQVVFTLEIL